MPQDKDGRQDGRIAVFGAEDPFLNTEADRVRQADERDEPRPGPVGPINGKLVSAKQPQPLAERHPVEGREQPVDQENAGLLAPRRNHRARSYRYPVSGHPSRVSQVGLIRESICCFMGSVRPYRIERERANLQALGHASRVGSLNETAAGEE